MNKLINLIVGKWQAKQSMCKRIWSGENLYGWKSGEKVRVKLLWES